jgi:2-methylcitrate dehydratase
VQAAVEARNLFSDVSRIAEVNVRVSTTAIKIMADTPDKWHPLNKETADHSLPYATAIALLYGTIDESYYDDRYLHDRKIIDLMGHVHCVVSKEADRRMSEFNLCELELVFQNGDRKTIRVEYHRCHWQNPMTDAELDEKFRSLASKRLSNGRVTELLAGLRKIDEVSNVGAILALTSG